MATMSSRGCSSTTLSAAADGGGGGGAAAAARYSTSAHAGPARRRRGGAAAAGLAPVRMVSLDDYLASAHLRQAGLVSIDCEGLAAKAESA